MRKAVIGLSSSLSYGAQPDTIDFMSRQPALQTLL